jgi:hypothetical protein
MIVNKSDLWAGARNFLRIALPLLSISILCALINAYDPELINYITEAIRDHPAAYCFFRWGTLSCFILCWPYIALKIGQRSQATPEQILSWRKEVWRIGIWLILVELLVCENLINKAIHLLGGS